MKMTKEEENKEFHKDMKRKIDNLELLLKNQHKDDDEITRLMKTFGIKDKPNETR